MIRVRIRVRVRIKVRFTRVRVGVRVRDRVRVRVKVRVRDRVRIKVRVKVRVRARVQWCRVAIICWTFGFLFYHISSLPSRHPGTWSKRQLVVHRVKKTDHRVPGTA